MHTRNEVVGVDVQINTKVPLRGLTKRLVDENFLSETLAIQLQEQAHQKNLSITRYLIQENLFSSSELANILSKIFSLELFDLNKVNLETLPLSLVPLEIIQRYKALPLFCNNYRLHVAASDPTDLDIITQFRFQSGCSVELILVEEDKLNALLQKVISFSTKSIFLDRSLNPQIQQNPDDISIMQFINKIIDDAIRDNISDIHFEPYEKIFRVRFRQDGLLREICQPPLELSQKINICLKNFSQLDIAERRIAQEGRFKYSIHAHPEIDIRVSTCPTLFGEKIVLRILQTNQKLLTIDNLGFMVSQKQHFLEAIEKPQGMILVTGPTGSGKTVTLYSAINRLNILTRNISTVEDPVEIYIEGINQVPVNSKIELNFSNALKALLRQDPDIIMVGEIRDLETAQTAIRAAQTGHLVLSTLHTNNAAETLTRLIHMGVLSFTIATSINLIIAQRLVRLLCQYCKKPTALLISESIKESLDFSLLSNALHFEPVGCSKCYQGYKGRTAIFEVMPITERIRHSILSGAQSTDIQKFAISEGLITLYQSGLALVSSGLTSLSEIQRVIQE